MHLCALLITSLVALQEPAAQRLLSQANEFYGKRDQEGMAARAIEAYKKTIVLDETCIEAYWRLARTYYWMGWHEKESLKAAPYYKDGIEYLKIAVSIDEECIAAHYWLGAMYGLFGQANGIFQSLHLVEHIIREMEWVLKKDESFEQGGAHRILGRLYFKLPSLKGGDNEKAKQHLKRAIELGPKNLLGYLYLAEIYISEGKDKEARETLTSLLEQPDDPQWVPECKDQREDAKRLLASIEGK